MPTRPEILDAAIAVLSRSEALTLDAVARETGLTKPGVIHHVGSKEGLTIAVVDRIVDLWEADLRERAGSEDAGPVDRLRAYVAHALRGDFESSDLALIADSRLRARLCEQWAQRLDPWFGFEVDNSATKRASLRAARLLADGAWFNSSLGISTMRDDEHEDLYALAMQLIEDGAQR